MPEKLPKGWVMTTLGEVAQSLKNGIYRPASSYSDDGIACLRMYNIDQGKIVWRDIKRMDLTEEEIAEYELLPGDLLVNRVNSRELVGKAAEIPVGIERSVFESKNIRVRLWKEAVVPAFVNYRLLLAGSAYFDRNAQQVAGMASVNQPQVARFPLPLPPVSEQQQIVSRLDSMLARVAKGEAAAGRALERLKRYRAAVLHAAVTGELTRDWRQSNQPEETGTQLLKRILAERRSRWEEAEFRRLHAVGKPPKGDKWKQRYPIPRSYRVKEDGKLPRGWTWASIEQSSMRVTVGHVGPMKTEYVKHGIPFLRSQNIRANRFDPDGLLYIRRSFHEQLAKSKVFPSDVAVVRSGKVGTACVIPESLGEANCADLVLVQRPLINSSLLSFYMNSAAQKHVAAGKVGVALTHFNTGSVASLAVAVPPKPEQERIVSEVERRLAAADRLAATLNRQLERAQSTRLSLLREAFSGNLVPQNLNDEPASVLLERIRAAREVEAAANKRAKKPRAASVPKTPKEIAIMNQQIPTTLELHRAWQKIGKKTDARKLFEAAGFTVGQVADFYGVLRTASAIIEIFKTAPKAKRTEAKFVASQPKLEKQKLGQFRLVSVWLEDFKNLKDYEVRFDATHGLDIVLGWNGTGKSNLFEALVIIFRDLHYWWEKNKWPDEPMAGYRLQYQIEDHIVEVKWMPSKMKRPEVVKAAVPEREDAKQEFKPVKREELPLPKFVFGYYSGPTNRLADHFWPMKRDHYDRLRKASSDDPATLAQLLEQRRFFCAEASHAKYVLLAFSYKEDPKIWSFLEKRLRIIGFESALFVIRKPGWAKGKPEDFWGATGIMRRVMEKLRRYAVAPMVLKQKVADGYRLPSEELYYFFLPDLKSLHDFAAEYADARSFFLALESTDFSELIYDVKIQVRVKAADNKKLSVTFRELSEGEQQLLMVLGLMRFTKSHQSLILLDEPDTHLNPHWSVDYLKDLASVVSDDDKPSPEQQTSQLLMATHDPLVIASLLKEQVHLLKRDAETLICSSEQASVSPKGLGFTGILTSEMFGFRSDLDADTLADLDNRVRLVAKENGLNEKEKKELEEIDKRLTEVGFSKAFSDPYYAAFVRAWGRRYADQMAGKEVLTKKDLKEIDRIAGEVLAEVVAEIDTEVKGHALH